MIYCGTLGGREEVPLMCFLFQSSLKQAGGDCDLSSDSIEWLPERVKHQEETLKEKIKTSPWAVFQFPS